MKYAHLTPRTQQIVRLALVVACAVAVTLMAWRAQAAEQRSAIGPVALQTADGPMRLHIIQHASFVTTWHQKTVYVDPVGEAAEYAGLPAPDLILITHGHGDHFKPETLAAIDTRHATVVMPKAVAKEISDAVGDRHIVLANGERATAAGIPIEAIPAYNLPAAPDAHHPKGWGNGYVLTLADKRVYISGDTEGVPAMRRLKDIDLAFVCMNLPYTMDTKQAADAVLDFAPRVVYPYHYRGQDIGDFRKRVNAGNSNIEVRLRDWYPNTDES